MTNNLYMCQSCAQVWLIEKSGTLTTRDPGYCPSCRMPIKPVRSSFGSLQAPCFAKYSQELVKLVFEQWAANLKGEKHAFTDFVDYLTALVNE